jgi:hypothetical protein
MSHHGCTRIASSSACERISAVVDGQVQKMVLMLFALLLQVPERQANTRGQQGAGATNAPLAAALQRGQRADPAL